MLVSLFLLFATAFADEHMMMRPSMGGMMGDCCINSPVKKQKEVVHSLSCIARMEELGCYQIALPNERRNCNDALDVETLDAWTTDPLKGCSFGFIKGIVLGLIAIPATAIELTILAGEKAKESTDRAYDFFKVCDKSISCRRLLVTKTPHLNALQDTELMDIPLFSLVEKIQFARDSAERASTMSKAMRGERPTPPEEMDPKHFRSLTMELVARASDRKYRQFLCYNSKRAAEMLCELPGEIYGVAKFAKVVKSIRPSLLNVEELPKTAVTPSPYGASGRVGNPLAIEAPEIADVTAFANRFQAQRAEWIKANPTGPVNIPVPEFKVIVETQIQEIKKLPSTVEGRALLQQADELVAKGFPYEDTLSFSSAYTHYVNKVSDKSSISIFSATAQEFTSALIAGGTTTSYNRLLREGAIIYPTARELGPESINRMVAAGVAPEGTVSRVTTGDGLQLWMPRFYKLHDRTHTVTMGKILEKAAKSPEHREQWSQFFTKIEKLPSRPQRTLNELVVFQMQHEEGLLVSALTQKQREQIMKEVLRRLEYEAQSYGIPAKGPALEREVSQSITWVEKNMPKP